MNIGPPLRGLALVACASLISGCSVRLPMQGAVAERLTDGEVKRLEDRGQGASVPGTWLVVGVSLPRESLRKIATWQLYAHVLVKNCQSGETISVIPSAEVQEAGNSFDRMKDLLADRSRETFMIGGTAFIPANRSMQNLCVQLDGGSYTLQTIASKRIPLEIFDGHRSATAQINPHNPPRP